MTGLTNLLITNASFFNVTIPAPVSSQLSDFTNKVDSVSEMKAAKTDPLMPPSAPPEIQLNIKTLPEVVGEVVSRYLKNKLDAIRGKQQLPVTGSKEGCINLLPGDSISFISNKKVKVFKKTYVEKERAKLSGPEPYVKVEQIIKGKTQLVFEGFIKGVQQWEAPPKGTLAVHINNIHEKYACSVIVDVENKEKA